jgi:uncharacterized membrane protein
MSNLALSPFGLLIAGIMAIMTVFMEVARKKAVSNRPLTAATCWCHVFDSLVFVGALSFKVLTGTVITIHDSGDLFGISGLDFSPLTIYLIYQAINIGLLSIATYLFFLALQVSPMSTCVPFLAFTSVLLIPTGFVLLGEMPGPAKLLGVALVVVGSLTMHRRLFGSGWTAPAKAIVRERGSRYMLIVAFILALTSPLEKKLVLMTDVYTQALAYGVGMSIVFGLLAAARNEDFRAALRNNFRWVAMAGVLDAIALLLQFTSFRYIDVVIAISIKRAGIVLAVFFGWLFFRERGIADKLIAASVMFAGTLILYFPLTPAQATIMTFVTLIFLGVALHLTRAVEPSNRAEEAKTVPKAC